MAPLAPCSCSLEIMKIGLGFVLCFQSIKSVSYYHCFCLPQTSDNKLAHKFFLILATGNVAPYIQSAFTGSLGG